jgi:Protein of unknown function (DUF4058)
LIPNAPLGGIIVPAHDWTRVEAGIFHDFHHSWVAEISDALNTSVLPHEYYALLELLPKYDDVDMLEWETRYANCARPLACVESPVAIQSSPPATTLSRESDISFFERKQKVVTIRHVSDDRVVAVVEIVSPGNKSGRRAFQALLDKACDLIHRQVQLLIVDLLPPGPRDPQGVHAAIWEEFTGDDAYRLPAGKPLTLAAYESGVGVRAYVEHFGVGEPLIEMPLFLYPGGHVPLALEATYTGAFNAVPRRWRAVLESDTN